MLSPKEEKYISKNIKTKPKQTNPPDTLFGCLFVFPVLLFTLFFIFYVIGSFVLSKLSEERYQPGDIPASNFYVLVDIPGWDRPDIYRLGWTIGEKYFDRHYPRWSFYEPETSGSIKSSFSTDSCIWSVEKLSTSRKRIELRCHGNSIRHICIYEIENNEITPVFYKQPAYLEQEINESFLFTIVFFAFIISAVVSLLIVKRARVPQYPSLDE
jgi:hypothetical protein